MKKILFTFALLLSILSAFAQQGEKAIGAHLSFAGKNGQLGFGLKGQYFINDNFRLEGVFDNYFAKKNVGMWDIAANVHYVINIGDRYAIYPLLGFTIANWHTTIEHQDVQKAADGKEILRVRETTDHTLRFGSNFGAGIEYGLNNNVRAYLEAKNQIVSSYSQWVFNLGLKYRF